MAYQILSPDLLKQYKATDYEKKGGGIYLKPGVQPIAGTVKTVADPSGRSLGTADAANSELTDVNQRIGDVNTELGKYGDTSSYLGLLRNTFNASYAANQDIIQARRDMRAQLYGQEPAYKPQGWEMMTPEQQNAVRNAPKPGLSAGIQALNETEAARGRKVENVLGQARDEATDRRNLLTTELTQLTNRRSELEQADQKLKSDNRTWALDALTKYPTLATSLTDKELANINKGVLDDAILAKISAASATEDQKSNVKQVEFTDSNNDTFIIGVDEKGNVLYRTPLGKAKGTGTGSGTAGERDKASDIQSAKDSGAFLDDKTINTFINNYDSDFINWFMTRRASDPMANRGGSGPEGQYTITDINNEYKNGYMDFLKSTGTTTGNRLLGTEVPTAIQKIMDSLQVDEQTARTLYEAEAKKALEEE